MGVPVHTAKFHLDRLVAEGLLDRGVPRGSAGAPGRAPAGPSKLYRRSEREWSVSLPPRRYDLVGHILATGVDRARREPVDLDDALVEAAAAEGVAVGRAARPGALPDVLAHQGYEPRDEDGALVLTNCPFDALAEDHTDLVCGLNRTFVQGVADGLGRDDVEACLEPRPGHCCVTVRRR